MKGSVIIDGVDIANFGMFILKGGDYDFLSLPERKEPEQNNWHEYDGVDADLSEIYFKEKKVTVQFYIKANTGEEFIDNLNTFYTLISASGYRQLYSREFDKTFFLRYVSCPEYSHRGGLYKQGTKRGELSVEFSMDDPLQIFTSSDNLIPRRGRSSKTGIDINGSDLCEFGIVVNECYNTLLGLSAIKSPLTRSFDSGTGCITYPSSQSTFEKKQVIIECTMMADNRADFYYNYETLFNNLSIKEAVRLTTFAYEDASCYYLSMTGFEKVRPFASHVFIKFSLNLILTNPGLIDYVLETEDSIPVITETGNYLIKI